MANKFGRGESEETLDDKGGNLKRQQTLALCGVYVEEL